MTTANPTVGGDKGVWGNKLNTILDEVRPGATRGEDSVIVVGGLPFKIFRGPTDPVSSGQLEVGDWWVRTA